jgi:pimeloyl-ACP methyl ester carboxylesterase
MIANGELLFQNASSIPSEEFLRLFRGGAGSAYGTPEQLPEDLAYGVELLKRERPSWEAEIPLDRLAAAGFPVLVLSGGHSPAFEAVCNALADGLSAERAVIPGRGHTVPSSGAPYNARLSEFLSAAESGA